MEGQTALNAWDYQSFWPKLAGADPMPGGHRNGEPEVNFPKRDADTIKFQVRVPACIGGRRFADGANAAKQTGGKRNTGAHDDERDDGRGGRGGGGGGGERKPCAH